MDETLDRRVSPQAMWPQAQSAIMLAFNYGPEIDPLANLERPEIANISVYARNRDYHDIIKGKQRRWPENCRGNGQGRQSVCGPPLP